MWRCSVPPGPLPTHCYPSNWALCLADGVVRMLHFNSLPASGVGRPEEDVYKVLVMDRDTKDVLAPLLHVNVGPGGGAEGYWALPQAAVGLGRAGP